MEIQSRHHFSYSFFSFCFLVYYYAIRKVQETRLTIAWFQQTFRHRWDYSLNISVCEYRTLYFAWWMLLIRKKTQSNILLVNLLVTMLSMWNRYHRCLKRALPETWKEMRKFKPANGFLLSVAANSPQTHFSVSIICECIRIPNQLKHTHTQLFYYSYFSSSLLYLIPC